MNPYPQKAGWILSPVRLPVPPLSHGRSIASLYALPGRLSTGIIRKGRTNIKKTALLAVFLFQTPDPVAKVTRKRHDIDPFGWRLNIRAPDLWSNLRQKRRIRKEPLLVTSRILFGLYWSGRVDLNHRPSEPHSDTLPGCATPRLCLLRMTWYNHPFCTNGFTKIFTTQFFGKTGG